MQSQLTIQGLAKSGATPRNSEGRRLVLISSSGLVTGDCSRKAML